MVMIVLSKKPQACFSSAIQTHTLCLSLPFPKKKKGGTVRGRNGNGKKAASHFESKWLGRSLIAVSCSICWSGFNLIPLYDCTHKILIDFPFSLSPDVSFYFPPVTKVSSQQGKARKNEGWRIICESFVRETIHLGCVCVCVCLCVCVSGRGWCDKGLGGEDAEYE